MPLDADACYRALAARDDRFDGVFFVGVSTTGIYCRPICPARTPGRDRCTFFARAALAEREGFRACFRCRPERAPGTAQVDGLSRTATAALAGLDDLASGAIDVEQLAARVGVASRHLRRAMKAEIGVGPLELATSRRLAVARQLLSGSSLPVTEVALASGFSSVRRFNASYRAANGEPPGDTRRRAHSNDREASRALSLRLDVRPPYDFAALLAFLGARAVPGVEAVLFGTYLRVMRLDDHVGWVTVQAASSGRPALLVEVSPSLTTVLLPVMARVRRLFDTDAQPAAIAAHLGHDPVLAPLVRARPGLRIPGAVDGFEIAARAILGQQVSVAGARTIAGRLAARLGRPILGAPDPLRIAWPTAAEVAGASETELRSLGLPGARARALGSLARAVADGALCLDPHADVTAAQAKLQALPGIGPWTASYVAMRALGWPDAFLEGDLILRRNLGVATSRAALARAEAWRPWRAYAALHLWSAPEPLPRPDAPTTRKKR